MKKKISQICETHSLSTAMESQRTTISIFHDNPQLSKNIAAQDGMEILVESALTKSSVKMLFGKVIFSGTFDPSIAGIEIANMRGGDIIVAEVVELISTDLGKFPSRMVDGIKELYLRGSKAPDIDRKTTDILSNDIEEFFAPCTGRVDVVLDPIQDEQHQYYPYFEGTRKLAPQFRSHGVGYIRLGDDMSNFGTAFISLDFGKTFLDHGANDCNIMSSNMPLLRSAKKKPRPSVLFPSATNNTVSTASASAAAAVDAPSRDVLRSAKKVRIQPVPDQSSDFMSKPALEPNLGSRVLTRSQAKRAAAQLSTQKPQTSSPTVSSRPESAEPPVSARKRNRTSLEAHTPAQKNLNTIEFVSPERSTKKPKLAESLRRSVRASRTSKGVNSDASSLPTPRKLNMVSITTVDDLEKSVSSFLDELRDIDQSGAGSSAWKTKVSVVKRFQQDLQQIPTDDLGSAVNFSLILRLVETTREQIAKTSNPMYTVTVLDLAPTVATIFLQQSNDQSLPPDESASLTAAWQNLFSECIQQARNSNRQIEVAAMRSLTTAAQQALLTWPTLLLITETWLGLVPGTSTPKNLVKLNKVLEFIEQRVVVDGKNAGSALFQPPGESKETSARVIRIGVVGSKDRDEKNRAAGLQLIAAVLVTSIVMQQNDIQSNQGEVNVAQVIELLSSSSKAAWLLEELQKASIPVSKMTPLIEKVLPRLYNIST